MKQRRLSMPIRWLLLIGLGAAVIVSMIALVAQITHGAIWGILPWLILVSVLFSSLMVLMNYLMARNSR